MISISVIIPACNSEAHLPCCLRALRVSTCVPTELIVVDDGSKDSTRKIAEISSTKVLATDRRMGPAHARNLGAQAASGDVLFFLDSDVCVKPNTILLIAQNFENDPYLDALIGSYDEYPTSRNFLSQYRNLMHAYVHQTGSTHASTFWSGCGAIRREVFLQNSGFDESYKRPAIEDVELGYRLRQAGCKLILDRAIEVTHLKRWTLWSLITTDIFERGIPWTELILRDRFMPNDLNLQVSQRISVALVFVLIAIFGMLAFITGAYLLVPLIVIVFLMLTGWWTEVSDSAWPVGARIMLIVLIAFATGFSYSHRMFALIPPLAVSPFLLYLRLTDTHGGRHSRWRHAFAITFILVSVGLSLFYLPAHRLLLACFVLLVLIGILNSRFYFFLAGRRGIIFMLAAIPFHLLYHFYNGVSFITGLAFYAVGLLRAKRIGVRC
jgi:GT2 family glycosyltransferase